MKPVDEFSVVPGELTSRLRFQGEPVGIRLHGTELHHQFRCAGGYLLITTEDDFSWTYHRFWYLTSPQALCDGRSLPRQDYYYLCDFHSNDDGELEFGVAHTEQRWRLTIRPHGPWSLKSALWVGLINPRHIRYARRCLNLTRIS